MCAVAHKSPEPHGTSALPHRKRNIQSKQKKRNLGHHLSDRTLSGRFMPATACIILKTRVSAIVFHEQHRAEQERLHRDKDSLVKDRPLERKIEKIRNKHRIDKTRNIKSRHRSKLVKMSKWARCDILSIVCF